MDINGSSQSCKQIDVQAIALPVFKGENADVGLLRELDQMVGGLVSNVIQADEFKAKEGETAYFYLSGGNLKAQRLLLIGCGERAEYKAAQLSQMAGTATRFLRSKNVKTLAIVPRADSEAGLTAEGVVEGALMGLFEPDKYRTQEKEKRQIEKLVVTIDG